MIIGQSLGSALFLYMESHKIDDNTYISIITHFHCATLQDIQHYLHLQTGIMVSLPTISRHLMALNIKRVKQKGGNICYLLPEMRMKLSINDSIASFVQTIECNQHSIVIKTLPSMASLIAKILTNCPHKYVLAAIGSHDTVFVIPKNTKQLTLCMQEIESIVGK